MKTVGLITEYNPFHLGHKYHIEQAKKITGADAVIVIMSGNYVQRGEPAFVDKYTRTNAALRNGADLVLELPLCFAAASAEYFSYGAVSILDKLNKVDFLCFGVENDNISHLYSIAEILANEPDSFKADLKSNLKSGLSFPAARQKALANNIHCENILDSPNNILGVEYLKALIKRGSKIKPVPLKRIKADYHDTAYEKRFFSATAIRRTEEIITTLDTIDPVYRDTYKKTYPIISNDFSTILGTSLLKHCSENNLDKIFGINQRLSDRIQNNLDLYCDYESFISLIKTKDISFTAVSRALLHCALNIYKKDVDEYMSGDICDFIRVLGFTKTGASLLGEINKKSAMGIITNMSHSLRILENLPDYNHKLFDNWLMADKIYRLVGVNKFNFVSPTEYNRKLITL